LPLDPPQFVELAAKYRNSCLAFRIVVGERHQHADPPRLT
jgi:hypothetical protein